MIVVKECEGKEAFAWDSEQPSIPRVLGEAGEAGEAGSPLVSLHLQASSNSLVVL